MNLRENKMPCGVYETERLFLREWRESDKASFAEINSNPVVMEHFPALRSRQESDQMVDRFTSRAKDHGFSFRAVELKDRGAFLGFVGISKFNLDLPFSPCVEIGWRLAHKYWGHGYATEAARKWLEIGFNRFALAEIYSFTALQNQRSRSVMSKIGMQNTKENFEHPQVPEESGMQQHCLYRITKCEWLKNVE